MPGYKIKLIVNANADFGRARMAAADLRPIIQQHGGVDWAGTAYPRHASELAYQAGLDGYRLVIAAGGDGTAHEVVNGLMRIPKEQRPAFGVVPLGSGNDFAYGIGMPPEPMRALKLILSGSPKRVDIAVVKDDKGRCVYWLNTLGIGFDTAVVIRSRQFLFFHGFLIYLIAVVQTILLNNDSPRMQVETDRESWDQEMHLLVLCNGGREGGGFNIQPEAKLDDGLLHYAGIQRVSRLLMFRLLPEVMRGSHRRFSQVRMGAFQKLNLHADRALYIHTDGEIFTGTGMDVRQLEVEILPGEMEVVT